MRNDSNKSIGWLVFIEKQRQIKLKHALNGGEKYLSDAKVWADGYYEDNTGKYVFAFMRCFYHGCIKCNNLSTKNPQLNQTMGDLYRKTQRWIKNVKLLKYNLTVIWECEWDTYLETHHGDCATIK